MMIRYLFSFILLFSAFTSFGQQIMQGIKVSPTNQSLVYQDGKPFFWLGDTAWELFHRLTVEEVVGYLDNRKEKGFNVIQCVILSELDGIRKPNAYGELPLIDQDPTQLNENYFKLVDTVVQLAKERGLYLAILPTWGDKVTLKYGGAGPVIFNEKNAFEYGRLLGARYKKFNHIIWVLGGDRPPADLEDSWVNVYSAMAKGLDQGAEGKKTLKSFHPGGYIWESSPMLHQQEWMDFNMIQSGHAKLDVPVWKSIEIDLALLPKKPTIDAEPCYEDHPVNPWNNWDPSKGYFRDWEVRRQLYRSVFAGAFGVSYGHHAVWQFYTAAHEPVNFPDRTWQEALDRPAAFQAGYLKELILSRPSTDRIAMQDMILNQDTINLQNYCVAFADRLKTYAMVYIPNSKVIALNMDEFPSKQLQISWFNPETGKTVTTQKIKTKSKMSFTPPKGDRKTDWVLIIDKIK